MAKSSNSGKSKSKSKTKTKSTPAPPPGNNDPVQTTGPQFGETPATPDPTKFKFKHTSDTQAYSILDKQKSQPRPFPPIKSAVEPVLELADAFGKAGPDVVKHINSAEQIVFHAAGDTGNTRGPKDQSLVADKMVADYDDTDPKTVPTFLYHLGDVVYSFGEEQYYYDQFYDQYRDYPAPIFAIAGNHDGMVSPLTSSDTLEAFLENFCTAGQQPHKTRDVGELSRTAQIQPGVYFTLDAPMVRILGLYSNCLEDPGIISDQKGTFPYLGQYQLDFLQAALKRVLSDKFDGAVLIAVHHPPYVAQTSSADAESAGRHGGSPVMLAEIDAICQAVGVWPHAVLSGHAHNYQRFTRHKDDRETPFVVCGNSGHGLTRLTHKGTPALRTPVDQPPLSDGSDSVTFENYDDQDFGYLRIIVTQTQLRIEYHPSPDGEDAKTPDDFVTVDLATRKLVHFAV
jgi:hypothetical protein